MKPITRKPAGSYWGEVSEQVLAELWKDGTPTDNAVREAYPFGMRRYWPYKVWLAHVAWWRAGCPDNQRRSPVVPLPGQEKLL